MLFRSVISSIDIYESIFDNTISARLILQESVALVELLPIVGAEFVRIAFEIDYDFGQGQEQRPNRGSPRQVPDRAINAPAIVGLGAQVVPLSTPSVHPCYPEISPVSWSFPWIVKPVKT